MRYLTPWTGTGSDCNILKKEQLDPHSQYLRASVFGAVQEFVDL